MRAVFVSLLGGLSLFLGSCRSAGPQNVDESFRQATLRSSQPTLENIYRNEAPLRPRDTEAFASEEKLPGKDFDPSQTSDVPVVRTLDRGFELPPGDYVIPVLPFATRVMVSSPENHPYRLGNSVGKLAGIFSSLYRHGFAQGTADDLQILSWNIEYGVRLTQMSLKAQNIVDRILPEHRERLRAGTWSPIENQWNDLARRTPGLPFFIETSDAELDVLGPMGRMVREARFYREEVSAHGEDLADLSRRIEKLAPEVSKKEKKRAKLRELEKNKDKDKDKDAPPPMPTSSPWQRAMDGVYVRATVGPYQKLGFLEVRVEAPPEPTPAASPVKKGKKAKGKSKGKNKKTEDKASSPPPPVRKVTIDPSQWMAIPSSDGVQALALAPRWGGEAIEYLTAATPQAAASAIAAIVADELPHWTQYQKALKAVEGAKNVLLQRMVDRAEGKLEDVLNRAEQPARDTKVLDGSAKRQPRDRGTPMRRYEKPGGKAALEKDFARMGGVEVPSDAKVGPKARMLKGGIKVIAHPPSSDTRGYPVLEWFIDDLAGDQRVKIEIRYL